MAIDGVLVVSGERDVTRNILDATRVRLDERAVLLNNGSDGDPVPENTIGMVDECRLIVRPEDCGNDRHEYFWEKVKRPYLYIRVVIGDSSLAATSTQAVIRSVNDLGAHELMPKICPCGISCLGEDGRDLTVRNVFLSLHGFYPELRNHAEVVDS